MKMQNFIASFKIDIKLFFFLDLIFQNTYVSKILDKIFFIGHIGHAQVSFVHIIIKSLTQPKSSRWGRIFLLKQLGGNFFVTGGVQQKNTMPRNSLKHWESLNLHLSCS
jgi:hypothetical protein